MLEANTFPTGEAGRSLLGLSSGDDVQFSSLGVGEAASGTPGEITAADDIRAKGSLYTGTTTESHIGNGASIEGQLRIVYSPGGVTPSLIFSDTTPVIRTDNSSADWYFTFRNTGSTRVRFGAGTTDGSFIQPETTDKVSLKNAAGTVMAQITPPSSGETGLWLYDADNATLERVTVGAADSGGAGFKVLRIPN